MESLVDDTVNSNLPPRCHICGLDTSSISSSELLTHCQNCRRSDVNSGVDNSPVLQQTHRDVITLQPFTRPRCCSCLEKSTVSPSPYLVTPVSLDIPQFRPRSISNPIQHSSQDPPPESEAQSSVSQFIHNQPVLHQYHSHATTIPHGDNLPECHPKQSIEGHPLPTIFTNNLSTDTQNESSTTLCSTVPDSSKDKPACQQPCHICGGIVVAMTYIPCRNDIHTQSHTEMFDNINVHSNHSHQIDASSVGLTIETNATSQSLHEDNSFPSSINIQEDNSFSSNNSNGALPKSGDTIAESHSPAHRINEHIDISTVLSPDKEVLKTKYDSPVVQLTSLQMIDHNRELNRMTTTPARRTQPSSKSYHRARRGLPVPSKHSMRLGRDLPRIVTPDCSLSCLPSELFHDLHDSLHENDDLSAEVVYSLHFRDYQIKELLGKGISSTVRRVTEKSTGTEFAVKIIDISGEKVEMTQVEQVKKDTNREIRILRMCAGHSNIIELHDVFETPTFIFLVFEICRKGELFDYLTSVVSLSEKRTRIFMRQLIEAVAFIHDKDIVHRDLKPENILLDDDLNIKVSDFGFATVIEPGEELTELCGTPGYLAPEVLAHSMYENVSGYSKEVDMWACGVIMYTLLCGAPPFWNRRQMMMLRAIMNADYTFNSPEWDDITEPPKNLIQKLLVVNPKDRLTAKEALQHPFFHSQVKEEKKFQAHRKFRAAVRCIMFYLRLNFVYKHPPPISMDAIKDNPYGVKILRKVIDTCAFGMYKHWVKRVDNQNRAALFEHNLRDDWKHNPMTVDGIAMIVDGVKC